VGLERENTANVDTVLRLGHGDYTDEQTAPAVLQNATTGYDRSAYDARGEIVRSQRWRQSRRSTEALQACSQYSEFAEYRVQGGVRSLSAVHVLL
jgi:hypothetical protein